jgi:hypothetical protein
LEVTLNTKTLQIDFMRKSLMHIICELFFIETSVVVVLKFCSYLQLYYCV